MEALVYAVLLAVAALVVPGLNRNGRLALGAGSALAAWVVCFGTVLALSSSYEILSSRVTAKDHVYDPEIQYYSCGKDGKETCTRTIPRWRWDVKSDIGTSSQHTYTNDAPGRWKRTAIGDPFATTKYFRNAQYLSNQSVGFEHSDYSGWMPDYPRIRDGFQVDRCVSPLPLCAPLNIALANAQREWGPKHKVNVIVALVPAAHLGFGAALSKHWVGGKKNDAVLVLHLDEDNRSIRGGRVFSRSTGTVLGADGRNFNTTLLEAGTGIDTYDPARLVAAIATALPLFDREDLSKHDFWAETFQLPWYWILGQVLLLAGLFAAATVFLRHNPSTSE